MRVRRASGVHDMRSLCAGLRGISVGRRWVENTGSEGMGRECGKFRLPSMAGWFAVMDSNDAIWAWKRV